MTFYGQTRNHLSDWIFNRRALFLLDLCEFNNNRFSHECSAVLIYTSIIYRILSLNDLIILYYWTCPMSAILITRVIKMIAMLPKYEVSFIKYSFKMTIIPFLESLYLMYYATGNACFILIILLTFSVQYILYCFDSCPSQ